MTPGTICASTVESSSLERWVISLVPTSSLVLDLMEGARLGRVGCVIVRDQFGCVSKLYGQDSRGLLIGTGISGPVDEV